MKVAVATKRNQGVAVVALHPTQPKVKVSVKSDVEGAEPKVYILNKEDCPSYVQNGKYVVSLNSDGSKLYGMHPIMGVFKMKVKEFAAPKDKEPVAKTHTSKDGAYTYMTFMVLFEIVDGKETGMVVPGSFSYNFESAKDEVPGKGMQDVVQVSKPSSSHTKNLIEFLQVTGVFTKQIPWRENILPLLQKYILKEGKTFFGSVRNGYIDGLSEDESVTFSGEEEGFS